MKTANVYESRSARNLAVGVNNLIPSGQNAVLMGVGGDEWMVGNSQGAAYFAKRNFAVPLSLRLSDGTDASILNWADVGLMRVGTDAEGGALFSPIHGTALKLMLDPQRIEKYRNAVLELGGSKGWADWRWSGARQILPTGVVLGPLEKMAGYREVDATLVDHRILVYRAQTMAKNSVAKMRLQINWMDANNHFLRATIQVVSVEGKPKDYPLFVTAPKGAAKALVYANLHNGEQNEVLLQSVAIVMAENL